MSPADPLAPLAGVDTVPAQGPKATVGEALPAVLALDPVFDGHPAPTAAGLARSGVTVPAGAGWVGVREWAAGFVLAQRSPHTRRAYVADLQHFLGWCAQVDLAPGRVGRADLDRYARVLELVPSEKTGRPLSPASRARRLAVVAGLYRYAAEQLGWQHSPAAHLARPRIGADHPPLGPTRDEVTALLAAAEQDSPRSAALISLLVHTGLRIDEALSRDVAHWRREDGHQVLDLERKGGREAVTVLPAPVTRALHAMLAARVDPATAADAAASGDPGAEPAGALRPDDQAVVMSGPLFATATGGRVDQPEAWRLVRRLAYAAGLPQPDRVSPHALRHAFITLALDAGASLREVQDAAGHADPSTTRAYDEARGRLDRHPAYAVGAHLAATR